MGTQWVSQIEKVLWYLNAAAAAALIINLGWTGLYRSYRFLFAYLIADVAGDVAGMIVLSSPRTYAEVYFAHQTVKLLLAVFVVLELYRVILAGQPALARFGRTTVGYTLAAAAALAVLGLALDYSVATEPSRWILQRFYSLERTMDLWMLIFLVIISAFISWFPVRVRRNNALYLSGFFVYFLSRAVGLLFLNLTPAARQNLSAAMLAVGAVCLLVWIFALRPEGEKTTVIFGHRWDPAEMERLNHQLEAINSRLMRLARR